MSYDCMVRLSGDGLLFTPKVSQSSSNSNLLPVPETLWSSSYPESLPVISNTVVCSFHPNTSSDTSSEDSSETSSSTPSNLTSASMSLEHSQSQSGDGAAPAASDIKGHIIGVIHDIKGQGWSGSMGNAGRWPWL